jgi:hypothetical protein
MLLFLQYTRGYQLLILTTVIELSLFPILTIHYMGWSFILLLILLIMKFFVIAGSYV